MENCFSKEAWLVYNGDKSLKIDRHKVASACWYFSNLLEGAFRESKQYTIEMHFDDSFSFEAFKCVIKYANDGIFIRDENKYEVHLQAIQLGLLWGYEEFVRVVQDHLIETRLNRRELDVLLTLANLNMPILEKLRDACNDFAKSVSRRDRRDIRRCSVDGHKPHMYRHCRGAAPKLGELKDDDWDSVVTNDMGWDERTALAIRRVEASKSRDIHHKRKSK